MRFAYLIQGVEGEGVRVRLGENFVAVAGKDVADACERAKVLAGETDVIELCGAFGPEGAKRVIEATGGKIPVGYVVQFPQQDALYEKLFGKGKKK